MKKNFKPLISFLIGIIFLFVPMFAFAAVDAGVNSVGSNINLSATNPIVMAVKIINLILMFLSIIAVCLIIYGGFVWMTSNGKEDRIATAKNILKNALIGLVVVLSSWAIAAFVLSKLTNGMTNQSNTKSQVAVQNYQLGLGALGACVVENFYPKADREDVPRNTSIMVTFKEEVAPNSVCVDAGNAPCVCDNNTCNKLNPAAIQIYQTAPKGPGNIASSNFTNAKVGLSYDKKTIVIIPQEYLGEANKPTPFGVTFTNEIKNLRGDGIFSACNPKYLEWKFVVNGLIDLTPPKVNIGGTFPPVDNEIDVTSLKTGESATAKITVKRSLGPEKKLSFVVNKDDGTTVPLTGLTLSNNYQEVSSDPVDIYYIVAIDSVGTFSISDSKKQRGSAKAVKSGNENFVDFNNIFSFKVGAFAAGNSWEVLVTKPYPADKLTIGTRSLSFTTVANPQDAATMIYNFIYSLWTFDSVSSDDATVDITARPGVEGNNMIISSARPDAFDIIPFSGGVNGGNVVEIAGQPDQPMNSAIQINFSKEVNPLTITGPASLVYNSLRVVNANDSAKASSTLENGNSCTLPSDCLSYSCVNKKCVGDFVSGKFSLSSDYKTLEFLSDNECGVNGCGEKIYCLPAQSNLKVLLLAANLLECVNEKDCALKTPFSKCISNNILSAKTCANPSGKFYPTADVFTFKGIFDASSNSFDGNRSTFSDGPVSIFNENVNASLGADNFQWSFFISNKMITTAPTITGLLSPNYDSSMVSAVNPVSFSFGRLMLNSSLLTGSKSVDNGKSIVVHKLLNLRSFSNPVGYWISSSNLSYLGNGILDRTTIKINHSIFPVASDFSAQVGSGVRDIYQNCYKPSKGPGCLANVDNPSCCSRIPTSTLSEEGNCL
ncbi:MAG: pilin [Patescibacteria group bacterium]